MDSGYYAAYSGLLARTEALDSAASNLSNANTTGFRAEREYFRSAISGPHALESQLNRTVNDFGVIGGNHISTAQGALTKTGNTLDVAIEGEGFFQIQTASGPQFTRDGAFTRLSNGTLATASGEVSDDGKRKADGYSDWGHKYWIRWCRFRGWCSGRPDWRLQFQRCLVAGAAGEKQVYGGTRNKAGSFRG